MATPYGIATFCHGFCLGSWFKKVLFELLNFGCGHIATLLHPIGDDVAERFAFLVERRVLNRCDKRWEVIGVAIAIGDFDVSSTGVDGIE